MTLKRSSMQSNLWVGGAKTESNLMSNFSQTNPNPKGKNVGDCVVRAIALATEQEWEKVYLDLCLQGYLMNDMPSSNDVWGTYLTDRGWKFHRLQDTCPYCYTINDFCNEHNVGTYIVATGTHVVCTRDGRYLDTWDSGEKIPLFYFERD